MENKKWYKSKTVWLNIASTALMISEGLAHLLTGLTPVLGPVGYIWFSFGLGLVNLALRAITTQGLEK